MRLHGKRSVAKWGRRPVKQQNLMISQMGAEASETAESNDQPNGGGGQ